jgi:hypothetical protein
VQQSIILERVGRQIVPLIAKGAEVALKGRDQVITIPGFGAVKGVLLATFQNHFH